MADSGKWKAESVPRVSPQRLAEPEAAGKRKVESALTSMGLSTFSNQARRAHGKQAGRKWAGLGCRKDGSRKLESAQFRLKKSPGVRTKIVRAEALWSVRLIASNVLIPSPSPVIGEGLGVPEVSHGAHMADWTERHSPQCSTHRGRKNRRVRQYKIHNK